jgi:hypothetical protein
VRTTAASTDTVSVPATAGARNNVEIRGMDLEATGATSNAIDVTSSGANLVGITITNNNIRGATAEGIDLNAASTGAFTATVSNDTVTSTGIGISATTAGRRHADADGFDRLDHDDGRLQPPSTPAPWPEVRRCAWRSTTPWCRPEGAAS